MEEIWKDIEGYEGLYQVSNLGRIKSLKCWVGRFYVNREKVLTNILSKRGYYVITLCNKKNKKRFYVHTLVANSFISNPKNKKCVDHINTNKLDNRVNNLRWVTYKENNNNEFTKMKMSLCKKGKSSNASKKVSQYTLEGKYINTFNSTVEAQKIIGVNHHIGEVCNGKLKSCGGFKWKWG